MLENADFPSFFLCLPEGITSRLPSLSPGGAQPDVISLNAAISACDPRKTKSPFFGEVGEHHSNFTMVYGCLWMIMDVYGCLWMFMVLLTLAHGLCKARKISGKPRVARGGPLSSHKFPGFAVFWSSEPLNVRVMLGARYFGS